MHYVIFVGIAAVWGSSFILMKLATEAFGAATVGALRLFSGGLVVALVLLLRKQISDRWKPTRGQLGWLLLIVAISYAWPYSLQPWLIHRHGGAFIGMLVAFVPLLTVLAQWPILKRRASMRELCGIIGGLIALGVVLTDGRMRDIPPHHLALTITVPLGYACGNTLIRKYFSEVPTMALTAWCLLIATLMTAPVSIVSDPFPSSDHPALTSALLAIIVLGTIGTGGAITGLYFLIQRRGPLWAGMVTYLIPLGAVLWGWVDNEKITSLQMGALGAVLVMVALVQVPARTETGISKIRK